MAKMTDPVVAEIERLKRVSVEDIQREQLFKLKNLVSYHYQRNRFYREMMQEKGVVPQDVRSLEDLRLLPTLGPGHITTHKEALFSCPEENVTFLHTSGSTGASKIVPVTAGEKQQLAVNDALTARILGIDRGPIYCTYPCGPWPSAFFAQNGAELIGPTVRADMSLPIDWHLPVVQRFRPRSIMASPAYISFFASRLIEKGVDPRDLGVEIIKLAGEPLGAGLRADLEHAFGARVRDLYGSAEIGAASVECPHLAGTGFHHYLASQMIFEVQRIGGEEPCAVGEAGELLVTALFRYSIPIIRYRTKDIVYLLDPGKTCECGLRLPMSSCIHGRVDDMITYGGANVYPQMFYQALGAVGCDDKFQVALKRSRENIMDQIVVRIEGDPTEDAKQMSGTIEKTLRQLSAELDYVYSNQLVNPVLVEVLKEGTLYSGASKLRRFVDERDAATGRWRTLSLD